MTTKPEKLLTFRSGGWVVLLALLVSVALTLWAIMPVLTKQRPPGDGSTIESYGFDLTTLLIDPELMATPLLHRDMLPRLDHPATITAAQAKYINQEQRGKFLVSSDRVVGVVVNGEARAYPLSLLNVHEIINDTLGGRPIAVTYSWPGDAVRVFDRTVGNEIVEFGISGLLFQANMLMYDRRESDPDMPYADRGESLWSQLQARAISGPAAEVGRTLSAVPAQVVSWSHWQELYPDTTVVQRDPQLIKRYRRGEPTQYFISSQPPPYPVSPLAAHGPDLKDRVVVVETGDERRVFALAMVAKEAAGDKQSDAATRQVWRTSLGSTALTFTHDPAANTVTVEADEQIEVVYCLWFAWHAMYPDDELAE